MVLGEKVGTLVGRLVGVSVDDVVLGAAVGGLVGALGNSAVDSLEGAEVGLPVLREPGISVESDGNIPGEVVGVLGVGAGPRVGAPVDIVVISLGTGVGEVVLGVPVGMVVGDPLGNGIGEFVPGTLGNGVGEVVLGVPVGTSVVGDALGNGVGEVVLGLLDGCELAGALVCLDVGDDVCVADDGSVGNGVTVLAPTTARTRSNSKFPSSGMNGKKDDSVGSSSSSRTD